MSERTYDLCAHKSGCKERPARGSDLCPVHAKGLTLVIKMLGYVERPTVSIGLGDYAPPTKARAA